MINLHKNSGLSIVALIATIFLFTSFSVGQKVSRKPAKGVVTALSSRQIADKIAKSLVVVTTQDMDGKPLAQGSAFFYGVPPALLARKPSDVIDDLGKDVRLGGEGVSVTTSSTGPGTFVVSNLHVFKRAWTGKVKLVGSPATYPIKRIVGIDIKRDLCVFQIEGLAAPPLMLADPEKLGVGDDIYVGGNPRGLENTLSRGIISGIRKDEGFIQMDAAISSGSSGGPVVDTNGNVVGVAAASMSSGQNLNFAVAGSYLLKLRLTWDASIKETGAFSITDAENDGLIGRIRTVITRTAEKVEIDDDVYAIAPRLDSRRIYNELGNEIEFVSYDSTGNVSGVMKVDYDYRGIRSSVTFLSTDFEPGFRRYTDTENLEIKLEKRQYSTTKESEYKAKNGSMIKESTKYDRNGNETERIRNSANGRYSRTVFQYDDRDRCVQENEYRDGMLFSITSYKYKLDALGNWISQTSLITFAAVKNMEPMAQKIVFREISYF